MMTTRTRGVLGPVKTTVIKKKQNSQVLHVQPTSALKLVFLWSLFCKVIFPLGNIPSNFSGWWRWLVFVFVFVMKETFSADFGLCSEARKEHRMAERTLGGTAYSLQSKLPRIHNHNHKLCCAAINMGQTGG